MHFTINMKAQRRGTEWTLQRQQSLTTGAILCFPASLSNDAWHIPGALLLSIEYMNDCNLSKVTMLRVIQLYLKVKYLANCKTF